MSAEHSSGPRTEVIAIGDEMIGGARVDTNTAYLARQIEDLGLEVRFHTTIGDDIDDITGALRIAAERADVVVMTGGLGPTRDDLTRDALASLSGQPMQLHEPSLRHIEKLFSSRGREMPPDNRRQAMFAIGSDPLHNPLGTAPGVHLRHTGKSRTTDFFAMPGVPAEMKPMFASEVQPILLDRFPRSRIIATRVLKFFGIGESDMESRLGDLTRRDRDVRVGITVSAATISLRLRAEKLDRAEADAALDQTEQAILQRVGNLFFGRGETLEQEHVVADWLARRNKRLGVVEYGAAAELAKRFSSLEIDGVFAGGIQMPREHDTEPQDSAMNPIETFGGDFTLTVDAYPSMALLNRGDAPPATHFRLHANGRLIGEDRAVIGGHPSIVHARIAKTALQFLRKQLGCSAEAASA